MHEIVPEKSIGKSKNVLWKNFSIQSNNSNLSMISILFRFNSYFTRFWVFRVAFCISGAL